MSGGLNTKLCQYDLASERRGFLAHQAVKLMHSRDGTNVGVVGRVANESLALCTKCQLKQPVE